MVVSKKKIHESYTDCHKFSKFLVSRICQFIRTTLCDSFHSRCHAIAIVNPYWGLQDFGG